MRERVEQLARRGLPADLAVDVPLALRAPAAPRGAGHRPVARLRHLRLVRPARRRQAGAEGARHRRQDASAARGAGAHQPGQEPDGDARGRCGRRAGACATSRSAEVYEAYLRALDRRRRARLRRPAAQDRRAVRDQRARARLLRAQVQVRARRRVPGHEPAAVPADPAAGRGAPQPLRRRRSRPVDLPLARRRPAQHPRLRARLPRRARSSSSSRTTARRR